jgi:hypothetical protein
MRASGRERLFMVHVSLSGESQFLAPVAQEHWGMNRLGVDLENWRSSANLAPHSQSPIMRRALQIAIGNSSVIQAVGFTTACIYEFTVGGSPFHAIFRKWCTLIPCQLARFGVRFLLFQRGKTRRLLRFSFGVIAKKQPLKLQMFPPFVNDQA